MNIINFAIIALRYFLKLFKEKEEKESSRYNDIILSLSISAKDSVLSINLACISPQTRMIS